MTITITGLPLQGTLLDTTNIPVETAGVTGHIAASTIKSYLSAGTLTSISAATGTISGILQSGSISTTDITAATIHTTSYATVDGTLTVGSTSSFAGEISHTVGNISTLGNVNAAGVFTSNIIAGNLAVTGNITGQIKTSGNLTAGNISPTANITQSIGSGSLWYNSLYSASATTNNLTINSGISVGTTGVANIGSSTSLVGNIFTVTATVGGLQPVSTASNIGTATTSFGNIYVGNGGIFPTGNITANIGSSGKWFNTIFGVATQALYADLAEKYTSDVDYAPGTVLVFGEETEVTISTTANDTRVAGVVSTDPAYLMNGALENGVAVALQGRVPCKVIGLVKRGDLMVTSDSPGIAMTNNNPQIGSVIGKALGNHDGNGIGVIEVVVGRI